MSVDMQAISAIGEYISQHLQKGLTLKQAVFFASRKFGQSPAFTKTAWKLWQNEKQQANEKSTESANTLSDNDHVLIVEKPASKRRGRPPKNKKSKSNTTVQESANKTYEPAVQVQANATTDSGNLAAFDMSVVHRLRNFLDEVESDLKEIAIIEQQIANVRQQIDIGKTHLKQLVTMLQNAR